MATKRNNENQTIDENQTSGYLVELSKSYNFEGKSYLEIDLGKMPELSSRDLIEIEQLIAMKGLVVQAKHTSTFYCNALASKAANMPIEFFESLNIKDSTKVQLEVANFLLL